MENVFLELGFKRGKIGEHEYLIYKDNKKLGYFIFVLLILGFGSVIISGFTPSLTSDGRIYLNYLFVMIILDYLLVDKIFEFKNKN